MKPHILLAFALMGILLAGCSSAKSDSLAPWGDTEHLQPLPPHDLRGEKVWHVKLFGFPPSILAKCLQIEDDLPLRPKDLPPRTDEDDF